jgi:hypothetical protein
MQSNTQKILFTDKVTELALEAGGSHYPDVNRAQLEAYTRLVLAECVLAVETATHNHVCTSFDHSQHMASLHRVKESILSRFGVR